MSTLSVRSNRATYLFISGLDDVIDPVVVVDDRVVGNDGVDVAVLCYDACLRCELFFDGWKL